jgi:cold shock protein
MKGTVTLFNSRKGYGFIQCADKKEIFINRSSLPTDISLRAGDKVEFQIEKTKQGPEAKDIHKL